MGEYLSGGCADGMDGVHFIGRKRSRLKRNNVKTGRFGSLNSIKLDLLGFYFTCRFL